MKTIKLLKTYISSLLLSKDKIKELYRQDKLWILPIGLVGILAALGMMVYFFINLFTVFYTLGNQLFMPELLFFYGNMGLAAFLFLITIPLGISLFYFSKDIKLLAVLPIKESEIVTSKLLRIWLYLLPVSLIFLGPAFYVYVNGYGFTWLMLAAFLVNVLVLPFFPLCLGLIFCSLLMKLVNVSRYKTAFEVGGMILSLGLVIALQFSISGFFTLSEGGGQLEAVKELVKGFQALMTAFFPFTWAARAYFDPAALFLSLITSLLIFSGAILITKQNFLSNYTKRIIEAGKLAKRVVTGISIRKNKMLSLVKREWRIISSNSSFLFEALTEILIFPLLLLIFTIMTPANIHDLIASFIETQPNLNLMVLGGLCAVLALNTISCTSLSREGQGFALSLILPVTGRVQILGKMLFHLILFFPAFLLNTAIVFLYLKLPPIHLLYFIPGGAAFILLTFIISITIDLQRPLLKWTHPLQAMKQNMNVPISMGLILITCLILVGAVFLLLSLSISSFFTGIILVAFIIILDIMLLPTLLKHADRCYSGTIEVR